MSGLDLDALEAAARAATPGPWTFTDYEGSTHVWCGRAMSSMVADNHTEGAVCRVRGFGAGLPIVENAAFIASCDPTTVLALITRLRAAEARTAWQPIETAPVGEWLHVAWLGKPGWHDTRRDLWDPEQRAGILALQAAVGRPDVDPEWWVADGGSDGEGGYATTAPTHWRHGPTEWTGALPAAPEAP